MSNLADNISANPKSTVRGYLAGAITTMWFRQTIESSQDCTKAFDLKPHAALCLLIMATEGVSCAREIEFHLGPMLGCGFSRTESKILAEYGLYSLKDNGYLRLDAKGSRELAEHDHDHYGLGDIQWLITAKGARAIAPAYCSCKGLDSSMQEQAVKDIVATSKARGLRKSKSEALMFAQRQRSIASLAQYAMDRAALTCGRIFQNQLIATSSYSFNVAGCAI